MYPSWSRTNSLLSSLPLTPDTQTLLDEAEMKLFPPRQPSEDELTREVDLDVQEDDAEEEEQESERPRLGAGTAIDAAGSHGEDSDLKQLTDLFQMQPEAADEFDVLTTESIQKDMEQDEDEDEDERKQGEVQQGRSPDEQQEEDQLTGGDGSEESKLLVRDQDGYIEYYDDGEAQYTQEEETVQQE